MALNIKPKCPKCGSQNVSSVTLGLSSQSGGLRKTAKTLEQESPAPDKFIKPNMIDFNHKYYCNSCKHYFGGKD